MGVVVLDNLVEKICTVVAEVTGEDREALDRQTPLIGPDSALKSRALVELLLAVEDYSAEELGVRFDSMTDAAMSPINSPFRSIGTLAKHLYELHVQAHG
ncbi:hypothetical protein CKO27_20675 [Thiocystis violacea]|nr:hypothetical protein [Thiocystis violacea]